MAEKDHAEKGKVVAMIQARMGSSRLPGKVLMDICGYPMLDWVVTRTQRAKKVDVVMVATTTDASDDPVADWCASHKVPCYRGSALDVLDRFYQAAMGIQADVIVRLTADCPLIDPDVIDAVVNRFFETGAEFCANRLPAPYPRTYPIGLDVEVVSFRALERAWQEAKQPFEREHVLPYLYAEEGRFKVAIVDAAQDLGALRWTVDTREDLAFLRQLMKTMDCDRDAEWLEINEFLKLHPEISEINAGVVHKTFTDVDSRANSTEDPANE